MLDTVLLAFAASLCWGSADFTAGLKARTVSLPVVLLLTQGIGLLLAVGIVALGGRQFPAAGPALASLGAGFGVIGGLACFYRALASGTMSVVAPIAATGVAIPVAVGVLDGEHLALVQMIGMLAAVLGVVFSSRHPDNDPTAADRRLHRRSIVLALCSAVAFGGYFVLAHVGARGGVGWLLLLAHVTSVAGALGACVIIRPAMRATPLRDLGVVAAAGILDLAATGLYGIATRDGLLSIVAVAGSLYPVTTVVLARSVLRERVTGTQMLGICMALGGVALIAA